MCEQKEYKFQYQNYALVISSLTQLVEQIGGETVDDLTETQARHLRELHKLINFINDDMIGVLDKAFPDKPISEVRASSS